MQQFATGFTAQSADNTGNQYKAFYLADSNLVTIVTSITQTALGVLQNAPKANQNASLCIMGLTKMMAGGTITYDDKLTLTTAGTFSEAGSGDVCYGKAFESVSSGEYFDGFFLGGIAAETITQG